MVQAEYDMIYPNPSSGVVFINNVEAGSVLEIIGLTGKTVHSAVVGPSAKRVALNHLPSGLYLFKLNGTDGLIKTGRIALID